MKNLLTLLALLFGYVLFVSIVFTNKLMYIKRKTDKEIMERETKAGHFDQKRFDQLPKESFSVPSVHGYSIHGYIARPHPTNQFIIICHGVTMNLLNSVKYMNLFLHRGWNVVLYDHRRHGLSGGKTTSYGYYEKDDLQAVVQSVRSRFGHECVIGIHGESMGAATTLLYAGTVEDGCDFYIVDCPFSDLEEQLRIRLKADYRLPHHFVLPFAKHVLTLRDGYRLKDVSPLQVIDRIEKPVLFIHSEPDDYIPVYMTKQLYDKKQGIKQLFIAPKGLHAMSYTENRTEYEKAVDQFLDRIGLPSSMVSSTVALEKKQGALS
ncbi:alpha/beta hydrolase [Bacillus sp. FJAT-47783]|uniref:alpha/beta hydrolase n=1 Tax=Bacillus sp. FJAT-47783 TaxID=2922712 RepID=UPI001FAC060F|nr:alpha/beta hydrolase [Bacillus sp. FJAT-47783]